VNSGVDKREIAKTFFCINLLENEVSKAYESIADTINDTIVKKLLLYISIDSHKHSLILSALAKSVYNIEFHEDICQDSMGAIWSRLKELAAKETMDSGETNLPLLVEKMTQFESFIGEEQYTSLNLQIAKLEAQEIGLDVGLISTIVDWIIVDEDRHAKIMNVIYKRITK
jgi:rubrerythrin